MICANCGGEVADTANFCRHCGAPQPASQPTETVAPGPEPAASPEDTDPSEQLRAAVAGLQSQVSYLASRVSALEGARPAAPSLATDPAVEAAVPADSGIPVEAPAYPAHAAPQAAGEGGRGTPPEASTPRESPWNLEWLVGGNWLARIGILAVIIGVGFFLKLAFDNEWIGETGRVALGLAAGLALLGAGEFSSRKYAVWSQAVTGGGIAVLYLSIFAAFALYELIPAWPALGFSFLVTLAAAGLALRYEARAIAVLGIFGGFATPLFLADKLPQQMALLAYVLVLDVGVLALATFRNWRWFTLLALVGSLLLFLFWKEELEPSLALAQIGMTVVFLIFVAATTLFHLVWRRQPLPFDQALIVLNAAAYLGISYWQLWDDYRAWMGGFTLALALFYGLLAYGILLRHREQVNLSMFTVGVALVLLSIAAPVQLEGLWIGPAWAIEGAVLVWLSFFIRMPELRWFAVSAFVVTLGWLLIGDIPDYLGLYPVYGSYADTGWPVVNLYFLSLAMIIAAVGTAAYLWWRGRDAYSYDWEAFAPIVLIVGANLLALWALSVQVEQGVRFATGDSLGSYDAGNLVSLSLSGLWTAYAAALILLGIIRQHRWLRVGGLALLVVPVLKLFLYDSFELEQGYRVAAFIGLGLLLVVGGFIYQRHSRAIRGFLLD